MRRRLLRVAVALAALVGSLAAAEAVYRVVEPAPYRPGEIRRPDGSKVPLSEIIAATRVPLDYRPGASPRAAAPENLRWRVSYDRPAPGYFDEDGSYDVTTNHLGFRDREFDVEKKPGEIRVLCVGDSFTYGQGVRNDDAWPQVLERLIRERIGDPVEVINGGFAAASHWPAGYVEWIEHDGLAFHPDVLVIGFCLNDMGDVPMLAYNAASPTPWLGGASHMLNGVQRAIEQRRLIREHVKDFSARVKEHPDAWIANQQGLRKIRDLCSARGVRFVVAIFPMLSLLDADYPYAELHRMAGEFCAAEGIACVDLLDRFRGAPEGSLWAHPTDQHPNHEGHRRIAAGVDAFLRPTVDALLASNRPAR